MRDHENTDRAGQPESLDAGAGHADSRQRHVAGASIRPIAVPKIDDSESASSFGARGSKAWLIRKSGALAGARYPIQGPLVRVGRSLDNEIVIDDERIVSAHHFEIRRVQGAYRLFDLNSTNGTYIDGERVQDTAIETSACIRLGADGPELAFVVESEPEDVNRTLVAGKPPASVSGPISKPGAPSSIHNPHEELLSKAVTRARLLRRLGGHDQTASIMREMLDQALHRTGRKFKVVIAALIVALAGVSCYAAWEVFSLKRQKQSLDQQIKSTEALLEKAREDPAKMEALLARLNQYEGQARAIESTLLYRVGSREREDPVTSEIRSLMAEFGAETYSVPPEFSEEVNHFIQRYQGPDRPHLVRALGESRPSMESMRGIFELERLPPDLAYMVVVESAVGTTGSSEAGAAGPWQFTAPTAKHYGLRVDGKVDERRNPRKSTEAACKYIRDLILDFGSGSSVMLALAAYNLGPARVKQAVRKVSDPIKQRNFWYLYRTRALPEETREYVPKVIAAMIIARNPEKFGFDD